MSAAIEPIPFEQEYPEAGAMLASICRENAARKKKGIPLVIVDCEREIIADPVAAIQNRPKAGRNDPCPCNSGKKFKKCCGR